MSWAFISALKANPKQSYVELLNSVRDILETKYTQKPQLSSSHPIGELTPTVVRREANHGRHRSFVCDVVDDGYDVMNLYSSSYKLRRDEMNIKITSFLWRSIE